MKIAQITTSDMSIRYLLMNHLLAMQKAGFQVVAICNPGEHIPEIEKAGIRVIAVRMIRAITPLADLQSFVQLARVLRKEKPTIVHTHTPKAALLGQYAALFTRVPIKVHTIHGLYFPGHMSSRTRAFYVWLERLTMQFADLVLSQNPEDIPVAVQEKIARSDRITLLGNGIDLARFDPARVNPNRLASLKREIGLQEGDQIVGIVGRVNREKGYLEFFDAAQKISARVPSARFLIVGPIEPEKFDALDPVALARARGIESRVIYLGFRPNMPELYSLMDVLVLPSHREGFPRAPMEASAMGKPVVATNIRGCRQTVSDGKTGFLVPLRDANALADAVIKLLCDEPCAHTMGAAARQFALENFDERKVIQRTLDAYRELLVKKRLSS